jgi:hypothetical protein
MNSPCQKRHESSRVAQSELGIELFAPDKQAVSRVTHALAHACVHAVNDRTNMPRRGQLEPAALAALELLRNPAGGGFKTFHHFQFHRNASATQWGQLPPAQRARGGIYGCCGKAAPDFRAVKYADRSLRGNGLKPAPDIGGVGHSYDLPLGHSCDLPIDLISIK